MLKFNSKVEVWFSVHKNWHRDFTRTHSNVEHDDAPIVKKLRSGLSPINWKEECVL